MPVIGLKKKQKAVSHIQSEMKSVLIWTVVVSGSHLQGNTSETL